MAHLWPNPTNQRCLTLNGIFLLLQCFNLLTVFTWHQPGVFVEHYFVAATNEGSPLVFSASWTACPVTKEQKEEFNFQKNLARKKMQQRTRRQKWMQNAGFAAWLMILEAILFELCGAWDLQPQGMYQVSRGARLPVADDIVKWHTYKMGKACAKPIKCIQIWSFIELSSDWVDLWTFPVAHALNAQAAEAENSRRTSHEAVTMLKSKLKESKGRRSLRSLDPLTLWPSLTRCQISFESFWEYRKWCFSRAQRLMTIMFFCFFWHYQVLFRSFHILHLV